MPVGPRCSAGSSIRSAGHSTAASRSTPKRRPVERPAPAIIDRDLVTEPVQTGILVDRRHVALGRGQRELIIGDRAIGKTAIAVDAIINQKHRDMICVYVAIGQKASAVRGSSKRCGARRARALHVRRRRGGGSPGLQWLAPFAGFTMAEYFRDRGQHA